MSEKNNVFITSKGKKYHFYSSCNYLKGRNYQIIPLDQIKNKSRGPCTTCQRLYSKNGKGKNSDELIKEEDIIDVLKESKNNIDMDNIKINKEINNINNNNKKNNILPFIKEKKIINEKRLEKNKSSSSSSSDSYNEDKKNNKINEKENNKENFLPFNLDEISGIKSNVHNIDSKLDIDLKKENNNIINKNNINNNKKEINNENISANEEEEEEDEKEEENNNINNINNNNKIKEEYELFLNNNKNKNSLENMKKLKYNLDPNFPKKDLNWTGKDFMLLLETNTKSKLFFLQEMGQIPNSNGKKILLFSKKPTLNDNSINNGNYKFKFSIIPKKELKEPLEISVGFEIDFVEENSLIEKENKKMKLICDTFSLIKNFLVYKGTNKVNVLINIPNGKFFVIGNDELEKRNKRIFLNSENSDILYLQNFPPIKQENIKDVRPLFKYDISYTKLANIEV